MEQLKPQTVALWVISLVLLFLLYSLNTLNGKMTTLICDIGSGFTAERYYTYPILRTIANPDDYGKEFKNPLLTEAKYAEPCL